MPAGSEYEANYHAFFQKFKTIWSDTPTSPTDRETTYHSTTALCTVPR